MASSDPEILVAKDANDLARLGADVFERAANSAIRDHGRFTVALSGGSTPRGVYSRLAETAKERLPWDKIYFFLGDERHVPPNDPESNYRMANETLLSRVPVPPQNIFRVPAENPDASAAAEQYEKTLKDFFHLRNGELPRFDLVLLGLGPDGHTASLFPGTAALKEKSRLYVANWVPKFNHYRLSLTAPVINNAAEVAFLVCGAEKTAALQSVLASEAPAEQFPAKLIHPTSGKLLWLVDREALPASLATRAKSA